MTFMSPGKMLENLEQKMMEDVQKIVDDEFTVRSRLRPLDKQAAKDEADRLFDERMDRYFEDVAKDPGLMAPRNALERAECAAAMRANAVLNWCHRDLANEWHSREMHRARRRDPVAYDAADAARMEELKKVAPQLGMDHVVTYIENRQSGGYGEFKENRYQEAERRLERHTDAVTTPLEKKEEQA